MLPLYLHVNLKSDDDDDENATMSVHSGQELWPLHTENLNYPILVGKPQKG